MITLHLGHINVHDEFLELDHKSYSHIEWKGKDIAVTIMPIHKSEKHRNTCVSKILILDNTTKQYIIWDLTGTLWLRTGENTKGLEIDVKDMRRPLRCLQKSKQYLD